MALPDLDLSGLLIYSNMIHFDLNGISMEFQWNFNGIYFVVCTRELDILLLTRALSSLSK